MVGVRRGAFTCVEWQVTLCDPIWQVMMPRSRSSGVGFAVYLFYLPAKFHPDPIGNDGAFGFLKEVAKSKRIR